VRGDWERRYSNSAIPLYWSKSSGMGDGWVLVEVEVEGEEDGDGDGAV
jgi:hypothetical protein